MRKRHPPTIVGGVATISETEIYIQETNFLQLISDTAL